MSGFDVAAGSFAVVGMTDVILRTGRDIYNFFSNLKEAPKSIIRLQDRVRDTLDLVSACAKCQIYLQRQGDADNHSQPRLLAESALEAVNQDLQYLKKLIAKFEGPNVTWTRVKFVLDERRVEKGLNNLQRSNALLANALLIAFGEQSVERHQSLEHLLQQCSQQIDSGAGEIVEILKSTLGLLGDTITTKLEDHVRPLLQGQQSNHHTLISGLDAMQRQIVDGSNSGYRSARSRVRREHLQNTTNHRKSQRKLNRIAKSQDQNQRHVFEVSSQAQTQLQAILRMMETAESNSASGFRQIWSLLSMQSSQLQRSSSMASTKPTTSQRRIFFLGERRDTIMAHLQVLQQGVPSLVAQLLSDDRNIISARHVCKLESELQNLVASAAQETAALYPNSSARSSDCWSFSRVLPQMVEVFGDTDKVTAPDHMDWTRKNMFMAKNGSRHHRRRPRRAQNITVQTAVGAFHVKLPQDTSGVRETLEDDEFSISFPGSSCGQAHVVDIYFYCTSVEATNVQICAQLNVFVSLSREDSKAHERVYEALFKNGSIQDIDAALRSGRVSPYHLDDQGFNLWSYFTMKFVRVDAMEFANSQGIGMAALRHDVSIVRGNAARISRSQYHTQLDDEIILWRESVLEATDPLRMAIGILLIASFDLENSSKEKTYVTTPLLKTLSEYGYDCGLQEWLGIGAEISKSSDDTDMAARLKHLARIDQEVFMEICKDTPVLPRWNDVLVHRRRTSDPASSSAAIEEVLKAMVGEGISLNDWYPGWGTPSMWVQGLGCWPEWCRALKHYGRGIEELVSAEGNAWLLQPDWRISWRRLYPHVPLPPSPDSLNENESISEEHGMISEHLGT